MTAYLQRRPHIASLFVFKIRRFYMYSNEDYKGEIMEEFKNDLHMFAAEIAIVLVFLAMAFSVVWTIQRVMELFY